MSDNLKKAIDSLGFPKTAKRFVFSGEDAEEGLEEEQASRLITLLGGMLHLFQVHYLSFYDRTALINETDRIAKLFLKSTGEDEVNDKFRDNAAHAIADATREQARAIKNSTSREVKKIANNEIEEQVVMMRISIVARTLAIAAASTTLSDKDVIAIHRNQEPPASLVKVIVTALKKAYLTDVSEELENTFALHARTQTLKAVALLFKKRKLSP